MSLIDSKTGEVIRDYSIDELKQQANEHLKALRKGPFGEKRAQVEVRMIERRERARETNA